MTEQRLIDANAFKECWKPGVIGDTLRRVIDEQPPIDPESLPIVQQLRAEIKRLNDEIADREQHSIDQHGEIHWYRDELNRVTAERDAAQAMLGENSGATGTGPIKTCFGYPLDKVWRLVQADREGRCVVFKFSLGQTVYRSWVRPDGTHPFVSGHTMQTVGDLVNAEAWNNAHKTEQEALVELFTRKGEVD